MAYRSFQTMFHFGQPGEDALLQRTADRSLQARKATALSLAGVLASEIMEMTLLNTEHTVVLITN